MTESPAPDAVSTRPLYRHEELRRLIHPQSIAIIGASSRAGSFGLRTLNNLAEYSGRVYPINPRYPEIASRPCYASIDALPEVPDCVVVSVGREAVLPAVEQCVAAGVGGVILYASGYAETGRADLIAMQDELARRVAGTRTRLIGPNCLGITNYVCQARMLFGRMPVVPAPGARAIGIVTQSGSVSMSLGQAVERGIAVSHAIPVGNAADVGIGDLIAYLAHDEACAAIACVFEGVTDPQRLLEGARLAREAGKALVVYKLATGEAGAAAALSHTGAIAGSAAAYRAALEEAGAILVDRMEDVAETTVFFAKAGRPTGRGVAVVLASGGLGVMAADKSEEHGVDLPQPQGRTLEILQQSVPEFGAARNPCDVTAQALNSGDPMEACAEAMLADPAYSALLVVHPYADAFGSGRVRLWRKLAERHNKIICNYWSTESLVGHGAVELEAEPGIATFRSLDRCFAALASWHARERRRAQGVGPLPALDESVRTEVAEALRRSSARTLTERESKSLLARYGVPVVADVRVDAVEAAVEAARRIGYPVVMKAESEDIAHKTEAGVVKLNLRSDEDVRAAYAEIVRRVQAIEPPPRGAGLLIQPMVGAGVEVMVGARIDPLFGALLVVGFGGIFVEILRDSALALAPVDHRKAREMLESLKGAAMWRGFRGAPPVDLDRLADVVCRIGVFVADHAAQIDEFDVNPLICSGGRVLAVDALIVKRQSVASATG